METNSTQQEILLVTNTSLSQRQLFEKDASDNQKNFTPPEQLTDACWKGWLDEMLPGIIDTSKEGKDLYLWDILEARSFLDIELCESPQTLEAEFSINPYAFLSAACYT